MSFEDGITASGLLSEFGGGGIEETTSTFPKMAIGLIIITVVLVIGVFVLKILKNRR